MRGEGFRRASLGRRFAAVAAGLGAVAVLLTVMASWWLITEQQERALRELAAREREFHAAAVGSDLHALAARMSEIAGSTILATGLVDSAGRETYLEPFLGGIRQINGVPVQVLFTDFEGKEIARNAGAGFEPDELAWLRRMLERGKPASAVFRAGDRAALVALEPLTYSRTTSPEGAILYKIFLDALHVGRGMQLAWGGGELPRGAAAVSAPEVFRPLGFRVHGPALASSAFDVRPQYAAMLAIALVVFAGVVIAGVRLAQVLTNDLKRLEAFSRRVMATGASTERAPVEGSAEVASLARAMNDMLDRIGEQHAVLMTEREKLARVADALQAADRRKDDFLAVLAHELRNPLAPIRNSVAVMRVKSLDDPQLEWARDVIDRQVKHMARLLDDLLDVSRITRNKLELRTERVELRSALDAAVETSRPMIDAAAHRLEMELPSEPIYVQADPLRLAQVFANLLNNAAKYTNRGGRLRVAARREGEMVVVSVTDTGVGIASDQLTAIFDMFMQTPSSASVAPGGLGIGLSLVKALVEMHGGTVSAHSAGAGKGSEFIVRLPTVAAPAPALAKGSDASGSVKRERILIADDNRDAAESLAMMLRLAGHEVQIAHDGGEALAAGADFRPRIVLLDIGMPYVDGYEAARRMRREVWGADALIVALTGWGQEEDRRRATEAGFDQHLVKPVDPADLERLIMQAAA